MRLDQRTRVYVAGPMRIGDQTRNRDNGIAVGQALLEMGYAPFVPHLSQYWYDEHFENDFDAWIDIDLSFISTCDGLVRLPGESEGADIEVKHALEMGLDYQRLSNPVPQGSGESDDEYWAHQHKLWHAELEEKFMPSLPPRRVYDGRLLSVQREVRLMSAKKGSDYAPGSDPLKNVRSSEDWGVPGWIGCQIRKGDKMRRMQTHAKGATLANENVRDSILDDVVYGHLSLILFDEETEGKENA